MCLASISMQRVWLCLMFTILARNSLLFLNAKPNSNSIKNCLCIQLTYSDVGKWSDFDNTQIWILSPPTHAYFIMQHQVRLAVVLNCPSVCPSIHLSVCLFHTFSTTKPLNTKTNELIGMHINRGGSQAKGMEQSTLQIKRQGHEALKQATKIRFGEISQKLSDEL